MPKTVILGTARTAIGKLGGGLSTLDATDLGGKAIEAALERAAVERGDVAEVNPPQPVHGGLDLHAVQRKRRGVAADEGGHHADGDLGR